jgi:hypothetical protein
MVQFPEAITLIKIYYNALIVCGGFICSQLFSRLYFSRVWTLNYEVYSMKACKKQIFMRSK